MNRIQNNIRSVSLFWSADMAWLNGLSDTERREYYEEICAALQAGQMNETEFRTQLGSLGYNATDIEEAYRFYRPEPPENGYDDNS
jgi:hypothetical protein